MLLSVLALMFEEALVELPGCQHPGRAYPYNAFDGFDACENSKRLFSDWAFEFKRSHGLTVAGAEPAFQVDGLKVAQNLDVNSVGQGIVEDPIGRILDDRKTMPESRF